LGDEIRDIKRKITTFTVDEKNIFFCILTRAINHHWNVNVVEQDRIVSSAQLQALEIGFLPMPYTKDLVFFLISIEYETSKLH